MMRVARVSVLIASALVAQGPSIDLPPLDYSLGADSQPHAGVPAGAVTKHVLPPGKFFPGTPHNYQVYVPAQYDARRPIAYMIFLDGGGYAGNGVRVPIVLDNLIAKHDIPPMVAIFNSIGKGRCGPQPRTAALAGLKMAVSLRSPAGMDYLATQFSGR